MSNERSNSGADSVHDPLVSHSYRDAATERTPASLNEAILRQASAATGKGYSGSMRWLRPMAWAATILLSLAVIIQLSDVPQPEMDLPAAPPSQTMPDSREIKPEAGADMRQDAGAAMQQDAAGDMRQREAVKSGAADSTAFFRDEAPLVEEAENLAKMSTGADDEPGDIGTASVYSSADPSAAFEVASPCSGDVRNRPADWLTCIEELEAAGLDETAAEQRRLLAERYPDFDFAE